MKKILFVLFVIPITNLNAQNYQLRKNPLIDGQVILKDSTIITGLIKLNNSAFDVRFKKTAEDKLKKIDYKQIDRIIIDPNSSNERTFQYLKNYDTKWNKFVELTYSDSISIYIGCEDELSLFYSEFDRATLREKMNQMKFENSTRRKLSQADTIELPNGKKIRLPIRYNYYYESDFAHASGNIISLDYYLLKENSKLIPVRTNKNFLKRYIQYFDNCPNFVEAFRQKKIDVSDLPKLIEYYKSICLVGSKE